MSLVLSKTATAEPGARIKVGYPLRKGPIRADVFSSRILPLPVGVEIS